MLRLRGFSMVVYCQLLVCSLMLGVCACERSSAPKPVTSQPVEVAPSSGLKLGFIVKQPEEPWFQLEWKFADEVAASLGFELIKIGAGDGEKVLAAIDSLAAAGAKGFAICTPDVRLGPAIVARARKHNLKLIAVDDQFVDPSGHPLIDVPYLGISARAIGEQVGFFLMREWKSRKWPVEETGVLVITFDELDTARERTNGVIEVMVREGFPLQRIFKAPEKTADIPGALDAANALLTKQSKVRHWLVAGVNDNAVLGAVRALEGRNFKPEDVVGIGINGTDCIDEFRKPTPTGFVGSMLLAPRRHGAETITMLYQWVTEGVEPPRDTRTMGVYIDRTNFERVLKEQGILP